MPLALTCCPLSIWEGAGNSGTAGDTEGSGHVWLELSADQWEGGGPSRGQSPPVPTPHVVPAFRQVVAIDLDEGLNGLVSYRMQVGMPRMDFLINSSRGVVVASAELDRERIAEYQLRVVASDAGTPPKSSTGTLTIRGEGRGSPTARRAHGPWSSAGRAGEPTTTTAIPVYVDTGCLANGVSSSTTPFSTEPSLPPPSPKCRQSLLPTEPLPSVATPPPPRPSPGPGPTAKVPDPS